MFVNTNAQVFDMTSSWTEITTNVFDDSYCVVRNYKLNGDTIINSLQYTKVYLNDNLYAAAIRENQSKIYAYFYSIQTERLVRDFSWNAVGDPICFGFYEPIIYEPVEEYEICETVTNIDSILLLDGQYYKETRGIIKGISSDNGFFTGMFQLPTDGSQFHLLCFSKNGELIYQNPKFKNCVSCEQVNSSLNEPQNNFLVNVINVPNGIMLDIKNDFEKTTNMSVFNMAGIVLCSYQVSGNQQVTINLDKGFYFYQIDNKTGKFIVK